MMRFRRSSGGEMIAAYSISSSRGGALMRDWKKAARSRRFTTSQLVRGMTSPSSAPPGDSSTQRGKIE